MGLKLMLVLKTNSLQKLLGYFNHIFRLSELHQCVQEMLATWQVFLKVHWRTFLELATLACSRRPFWLATFLVFLTTAMQPRNSPEADVQDQTNNKLHQKCWFIGFLKGDTDLTKEGNFSITFCSYSKHSLKCMSSTQHECNWGNQNMVANQNMVGNQNICLV